MELKGEVPFRGFKSGQHRSGIWNHGNGGYLRRNGIESIKDRAECEGIAILGSHVHRGTGLRSNSYETGEIQEHMEPQKPRKRYKERHFQRYRLRKFIF